MSDGSTFPDEIPADPIGTWRRFGEVGPVYQILKTRDRTPESTDLMRVRVVESNEEFDYPLRRILGDPVAT